MPDPCPHNEDLLSLVLSWEKTKERPSFRHPHRAATGRIEQWAFGPHQRVALARAPQLLPQYLPVHRGSLWGRRSEEVGKRPQVPLRATKNVWARVGKEFLDMRQNERKIEFIRVGNAVRIVVRVQGKLTLNGGPWSIFISRVQGAG